jgi:hypothetical protein
MIQKTTKYYGKSYGMVYSSTDRKKANVYADLLNKMFGDYGVGTTRKKLQEMTHLVLLDHVTIENIEHHVIYVKEPYNKKIRAIMGRKNN